MTDLSDKKEAAENPAPVVTARKSLSEGQMACLRLVLRGMTSKEMAQVLPYTPGTIDTYLKHAIVELGARNRRHAAQIFAQMQASQKLGLQSEPVATDPEPVVRSASSETRGAQEDQSDPSALFKEFLSLFRPIPLGGAENDLSSRQRLIEMVRSAILLAAVMAGLVLLAVGALWALS